MSKTELKALYNKRIETFNSRLRKLRKSDRLYIAIKLLIFGGGFFLFFRFSRENPNLSYLFLFLFFIAFVISALLHEAVLKKINHHGTLVRINEDEITTLDRIFLTETDTGAAFIDPGHFYTSDLDIFGERSLFHAVNRTVTGIGREKLAQSLRAPSGLNEIKKRQEAVRELVERLDFRQNIRAYVQASTGAITGSPGESKSPSHSAVFAASKNRRIISRFTPPVNSPAPGIGRDSVYGLFDADDFLFGKKTAVFWIYLVPFITLSFFIALFFKVPLGVPLLAMCGQLLINRILGRKVTRIYRLTTRNGKILKGYARIMKEIEDESFTSRGLIKLKKDLFVDIGESGPPPKKASDAIRRLSTLLEWFDLRMSGMMHFLLNNTLLWDLHCVYRLEKWKRRCAGSVARWFNVIGEVEVISAFANLYFNNPGWTLPEIKEGGFRLQAVNLGHPLIPRDERVCNDISFDRPGSILLITGPNMAGKSTFLRTLGVNGVLALCGAPVCASHLEISPLKLITSMQSADSLDKHLSLFYAELQRLKLILDNIANSEEEDRGDGLPVFFLIDEMLKGTNALDRQKGSIALLKQLISKKANGTVATHDLKLTHLEREHRGVRNFHFDGEINEDRLIFDFKLRAGICRSANALILMKKVGINLAQESGEPDQAPH